MPTIGKIAELCQYNALRGSVRMEQNAACGNRMEQKAAAPPEAGI